MILTNIFADGWISNNMKRNAQVHFYMRFLISHISILGSASPVTIFFDTDTEKWIWSAYLCDRSSFSCKNIYCSLCDNFSTIINS